MALKNNRQKYLAELIKNSYQPVNSISGKVKKKGFGKGDPAIHRVITPWGANAGLDLSNLPNDIDVIVGDDSVAAIQTAIFGNKTILVSSDPSSQQLKNIIPSIVNMDDEYDSKTIKETIKMAKDFVYVGNNAFSITNEVLKELISKKPKMIRLVTEAWPFLGMPNSTSSTHTNGRKILDGLKELGLRKVFFLQNMSFVQYSHDGSTKDTAQVSTVVFHTELGYEGDIEIYDSGDNLVYTANRKNSIFLPRTKLSYEASLIDATTKEWLGYESWSHALGQKGYNKKDITPALIASKEVQDLIMADQYRIEVKHMNNGTPGNGSFWKEYKVGYQLSSATALDPNTDPTVGTILIGYGQDKDARDSHLSLMATKAFQEIYQAASAAKTMSKPVAEYFLLRFPADRVWTDQEVKDYVANNI